MDELVEWDAAGYEVYTGPLDKGGEALVANSPCALLEALQNEKGIVENQRGLIDRVVADCAVWRQTHPESEPDPIEPALDVPQSPIIESAPPTGADSPARQGARDVLVTAAVEARSSTGTVNSAVPSDAAHDQFSPIAPDVLASWIAPPGATEDDKRLLQDRIRQNQPLAGQPDRTFGAPAARARAKAGDPVDLFTGAHSLSVVDLVVPTAIMPIRFERFYRSGRPFYGPFGFGWDHCYNVYLRPLRDGAIALWNGQLQEQLFHPVGEGWEPERGLTARLERLVPSAEAFDVIYPRGLRWRFERPPAWGHAERIPLSAVTDRHGNRVILVYDTADRLSSVLDEAGHGLHFLYGTCGLLEHISDHTTTRVVDYQHHPDIEHLVQVLLPGTAEFPDGVPTTYEYDSKADHPAMQHNLLRVADGHGNTYVESEYASPEAGWAFNSVAWQITGGFEYRFEYEQIQYVPANEDFLDVPASRTSVAPPDGSLQVYTFNYRGDLLDHRFRLNRDLSFRVLVSSREYDPEGNLKTIVGHDGSRQVFTFDHENPDPCGRRNLLRVEVAATLPSLAASRTLFRGQYEPRYQLPVVTANEEGRQTRLFYDFETHGPTATGRLQRIQLPEVTLADGSFQRSEIHFEHNSRGQVTAFVSAEGSRREWDYFLDGPFAGFLSHCIEDPEISASTTSFDYDTRGFPKQVIHPGRRTTQFVHNSLGQTEQITLPSVNGTVAAIRRWYGDDGSIVRVERPRGSYDDPETSGEFVVDLFDRDILGHLRKTHMAANTTRPRTQRQVVDHDGRPLTTVGPTGARTDRRYDERGLLLREMRAVGTPEKEESQYSYDRAGRLRVTRDPLGRLSERRYDLWGRLEFAISPSGAITTFKWAAGDLLAETNVVGSPGPGLPARLLKRESFDYDERGRLRSKTNWSFIDESSPAVPIITRYRYDMDDRLRTVSLPRGATLGYEYDAMDRLTVIDDEHGNTHSFRYSSAGDLEEISSRELENGVPHEATLRFKYDARGRLRTSEGPTSRVEVDYDDRDEAIERRESGGLIVRTTVGPCGELDERLVDPGGLAIRSQWKYDAAGRMIQYVDPTGAQTHWQHDAFGRIRRLTLPDGSTWQNDFHVDGRRAEQLAPSGTRVTFEFDQHNDEPSRVRCAPGIGLAAVPDHEFAYDALGRLVRAATPGNVVERRYDSFGRVVEETTRGHSVRRSYDDVTGQVDLIFPDGRRERTEFDSGGRPTRVTLVTPGTLGGLSGAVLTEMRYAGGRRPTSIAHANGVLTIFDYDEARRLVRLDHRRGALLLASCRVRHDERGRRALIQYVGPATQTVVHDFDIADRLREIRSVPLLPQLADVVTMIGQGADVAAARTAAAGSSFERYELDNADARHQRLRTGIGGGSDTYVLAPDHRILSATGHPLTYHADGNRATDGRYRYDIDALGRIVGVRDSSTDVVRAEFAYDPLSRIATGSRDGQSFERSFLGTRWVQETHGGVDKQRQASPHPLWPQPLCVIDHMGTFFPHPDAAFSTMCITSDTGIVRERHRYGPFGEPEVLAGDGVTPIGADAAIIEPIWRGMSLVASIGLYASPQRLYDPLLGVFLARDPLLYHDSPSPYVYASQNPVDFADYTGFAKSPLGAVARSHEIGEGRTAGQVVSHSTIPFEPPISDPQALEAAEGRGRIQGGDLSQFTKGAYNGLVNVLPLLLGPIAGRAVDQLNIPKASIDPRYGGAAIVGEQLLENLALEAAAVGPAAGTLLKRVVKSKRFTAAAMAPAFWAMGAGGIGGGGLGKLAEAVEVIGATNRAQELAVQFYHGATPQMQKTLAMRYVSFSAVTREGVTVINLNNKAVYEAFRRAIDEGTVVLRPGEFLGGPPIAKGNIPHLDWNSNWIHSETQGEHELAERFDLRGPGTASSFPSPGCDWCVPWLEEQGIVHLYPK